MGINICMHDKDFKSIDLWDSCRMNADNDFIDLLYSVKTFRHSEEEESVKPRNVNDLKVLIDKWDIKKEWKSRYYHFCWLLRRYDAYYYVSY